MPDLINKLSSYAALVGVIGAIGGGFMLGENLTQDLVQLKMFLMKQQTYQESLMI